MTSSVAGTATEVDAIRRVSFFFAAHQDDWQLFMNPSAFQDVVDGSTRSIFIHVTAGDAGLGTKSGGRRHPWYLARENGAEAAIRFMADADNLPPVRNVVSAPTFCGHRIRRVSYRRTAAYFLRLPDGSPEGTGYADTEFQSLQRLAEGKIGTLKAIDGSACYVGWSDLVATVRAIIEAERGDVPSVQLNVPELDPVRNAGDHPDHSMTARVALDAAKGLAARRAHYLGYASGGLAENLSGHARDMKCAIYAVTLAALLALDHPVSWRHYDEAFIGRNYFRLEEGPG